jgi:hypothetical protein
VNLSRLITEILPFDRFQCHVSSADKVKTPSICDRTAFAVCPVFCRMIFVGEDHDADQRDLFFLL